MKSILLLTVIVLAAGNLYAQVTHVVQADGFDYSPSTLTINEGDSVRFDVGGSHPTRQVSEETWDGNGTTLLQGGFDFPGGNGTVGFPDAGTFYYVCTTHISQGMKGRITVQAATRVDNPASDDFVIYPVPLSGNELTIETVKPIQSAGVRIFDLSGSLRISKQQASVNNKIVIDCSALPAGVYMLKIESTEGIIHQKFVRL